MVSITLSVPDETRQLMKRFPEMNWSGFVRKCIEEKAIKLSWKEEMIKSLDKEKEIDAWAVEIVKKSRKDRLTELKTKGLL
jgi:hypothetical protein